MKKCCLIALAMFAVSVSVTGAGRVVPGILVKVAGGKSAVTSTILERDVDLAGAWRMLGWSGSTQPGAIRVVEISRDGKELGQVPCQIDPIDDRGIYTVCWQAPGELAAGKTRYFKIVPDVRMKPPAPKATVSATAAGDSVTVVNGSIRLTYSKASGGLIDSVIVDGVSGKISWADKAADARSHSLATHPAKRMTLLASGPLRVAYESESEYMAGSSPAPSRPRGVYRFIHYAGEPVVRLDARITQDFAHQWDSLHFSEIHFGGTPITRFATAAISDRAFAQIGDSFSSREWAAVYGDGLLIGQCNAKEPFVYDGGERYYDSYITSGVVQWSSRSYQWKCALFFGKGRSDLDELKRWSAILPDAPVVRMKVESVDADLLRLGQILSAKENRAGRLRGKEWIAEHVRLRLARMRLDNAGARASAGEFGLAAADLSHIKAALTGKGGTIRSRSKNGVMWGIAFGYPFIANERAAFIWALPEDGAGLISIYDKEKGWEYLKAESGKAPLWQVSVKRANGGKSYSNTSIPCKVAVTSEGLEFSWVGNLSAKVRAYLRPGDSLLRMRFNVSPNQTEEGLTTVVFPQISGILPISADASRDVMLDTWGAGELRSSPLISGTMLQMNYPNCMQFTGMYADGKGIYMAEEDGEANRKSLTWSPGAGALDFNISHPVLGWGGPTLVKSYASPGDAVVGPFHGDWYDAVQLYREWALKAPWCSGGPIYQRADYPRWLADAPYWTIGDLGDDSGVDMEKRKFDFFNLPVGICHAYGYYFPQHQDDRYPEMLPPKLGSVGLRNVLTEMHARGMRFIPYVNGTMWDTDTESYRVEDTAANAASLDSTGAPVITRDYGGQNHALMCPASPLWRTKLTDLSKQLVGKLGFDGVYYDFCNVQVGDCYNQQHGHLIAGGNYWTKSVRDMYAQIRSELKKIKPDVAMAGESNTEYVIGVLDSTLGGAALDNKAPLYLAVYHGYTLVYGTYGVREPSRLAVARTWLFGSQNGWNDLEHMMARGDEGYRLLAQYYRDLLHCHYYFARPYLVYGRMLRPPTITGYVPTVTARIGSTPFSAPAIEGSAWQAPEGTVGIFFLNYDDKPHEFTWSVDLAEAAGWKLGQKINMSQWTKGTGLQFVEQVTGGILTRSVVLEGGGLIALKLEVVQ